MRKFVVFATICLSLWPLACGPVQSENQRPTAQISVDNEEVTVGEEIFVAGTDSTDPDGDPLIHRWSLDAPDTSQAELSRTRGERVSFVPDVAGDYTVELWVDDGALKSTRTSVVITARETEGGNEPPVADAGSDLTAEPDQTVGLDASGSSDPDGDTLTFSWIIDRAPSGSATSLDDPTSATPSFVPDVSGTYIFEVEVSDPDGANDSDMVVVEVVQVNPNDPPVAEAGEPSTVEVGTAATLDGSESSDPNGDTLTFLWTIDSAPASSTASIANPEQATTTFTPDVAGEFVFSLTVGDGEGTRSDTVTITAEPPLPCLIIGEVYEGASYDKALEFYNCGDSSLDLSTFGVCLVQNTDTTCSQDLLFTGQLAAGETRVLCHPDFSWDATQNDACTVRDTVANFNGDDRLFLFEDVDATGTYTTDDTITDAFGEIANQPNTKVWESADYRRCNFEQFPGDSPFDHTVYYEKLGVDDKTHLGTAPTETCP